MSGLINLQNKELTMSSREIAEVTDKLHKNVLADIKNMFDALNIQSADFSANYKDVKGRTYQEYLLPKKYIECLLTGYSIPLRMRVIDRLHELEDKEQIIVPKSLPEALRLAAELAEEKELLKIEVNELKPKAEFHDLAIDTHGALSVSQAAKSLGTGRNRLFDFLREIGWVRRDNEPYQEKITQGLLNVKLSNWEHPELGIQRTVTTLITGKGLVKLSQMLN
ncbi:phage regulatory protein/antirepressor Ant [Utexia brackfieldae]|uniref:phage antirepressor KilAC domain-containing protein n=1 Tax=Utexia brackfieldae TaxID=3074108 RepID=UPI00370D1CD7